MKKGAYDYISNLLLQGDFNADQKSALSQESKAPIQ